MSLPVVLTGRCTTTFAQNNASITSRGALVVAPYDYDETKFQQLVSDDVPLNFYDPVVHRRFVITGVIATGGQDITGNASANTVIYEASSFESTVQDKVLLKFVITKAQVVIMLPLNILAREGKFITAVTDDNSVHINIMGYFIPS